MQTKSVVLLSLLAILAGCGVLELASTLRTGPVSVDGDPSEWRGLTKYIANPNSSIGAMNDDEYVYLVFSTPLKGLASQIMHGGLTVWFDSSDRKHKTFGVSLPPAPAEGSPAGIEILGPGKDDRRMLLQNELQGLEVALGNHEGRLVCELRVPLAVSDSHPYAIGAKAGQKIEIGLESTVPSGESFRHPGPGDGPMPEGMPDGGGGGQGAGRGQGPGGGGRRPPSDAIGQPVELEIWCKIGLASGGAASPAAR